MNVGKDLSIYNIVVGTAGHIDHGKSTLVRVLTGIDPDRLPEEKERGMTIDLGFAPFILESGQRVGIIDVPGHERFVKNMVAGATGIDLVILVIAADDGIMPQTREHLHIMSLLGIKKGLVALTKIDMVEQDFVEMVEEDIRDLVKGTFLEWAPIARVSSTTRQGIPELITLLNAMILETSPRRSDGIFRMSIQRIFSAKGFGTVVTGVPVAGAIGVGDVVEVLPLGTSGKVRGLQAYKGTVNRISSGHSSAINVADIDHAQVKRGDVVALPGYYRASLSLECRFRYLRELRKKLKSHTPVRIHTGTAEAVGRVVLLDKNALEPGEEGLIQLRLEEPVVAGYDDPFVLRLQSPLVTIGGGRILNPTPPKGKRSRRDAVEELVDCEASLHDRKKFVEHVMKYAGAKLLDVRAVASAAKLPHADVESSVASLVAEGTVISHPPAKFIHRRPFDGVEERIAAVLGRFHAKNPLRVGCEAKIVLQQTKCDADLFDLALRSSIAGGSVADERGLLRLSKFAVKLSDENAGISAQIERMLKETGFQTPRRDEIYGSFKQKSEKIDYLISLLVEMGAVVDLKEGILLHKDAVEEAKRKLIETIRAEGAVEAGKFKTILGTTRKYVIPLLEYFDQQGLTVRDGNLRRLK